MNGRLKAFYASPFRSEYRWIRNAVATACRGMEVDLRAIDEIVLPGTSIVESIHQEINDSDFGIAVITTLNPNVMYELGRLLQASKPTIILAEKSLSSNLPFDIRTFSVVFYDSEQENEDDLTHSVTSAISRLRSALNPKIRQLIASGTSGFDPVERTETTVFQLTIVQIDFEAVRREAERRMGNSDCQTQDIRSYDTDSFKGWNQVIYCPDGDEILIIIDLNGDIIRTKRR